MKDKLYRILNIDFSKIYTLPFYSKNVYNSSIKRYKSNFKFLYVADGVPQKNHLKLLEAWRILYFKYNLSFNLNLTIPQKYIDINNKINDLINEGIQIKNYGICDKDLLSKLYLENDFLIFPSLSESFGLPLIEAANAGCKIIASNLPFVYEIIKPTGTFNPSSSEDIAKVVSLLSNSLYIPDTKIVIDDNRDEIINLLFNY